MPDGKLFYLQPLLEALQLLLLFLMHSLLLMVLTFHAYWCSCQIVFVPCSWFFAVAAERVVISAAAAAFAGCSGATRIVSSMNTSHEAFGAGLNPRGFYECITTRRRSHECHGIY